MLEWLYKFKSFGPKGAVLLCTIILTSTAYANPVLNNVGAGNVSIQQSPNSTVINQTSQKAILNWQSFNIAAPEHTHFQQPAGGVTLNRISPNLGPSSIYGKLTATGQIILINPAGIFFGPGAMVNVGGLIATTANITDQNFLNGIYKFTSSGAFPNAAIINEGQIIAAQNGLVALVAPNVINHGLIQANVGKVILGSGNAFTISFDSSNLISFSIDEKTTNGGRILNSGVLRANGGSVLVTAKAAKGVLDNVINMKGIVEAKSVRQQNGEIILGDIHIAGDTDAGVVRVAGKLDASGRQAKAKGGNVNVTGYNILADAGTLIDVSGDEGAGNIHIGGNYQGKGPLPNANATIIAPDATLLADSLTTGKGGQVIVWANDVTKFYGHISARGGALGGDGGFVETSGKSNLIAMGSVDASAANGRPGEWLLDPSNVTISNGATANGSFDAGSPNTFTTTANDAVANVTTIQNSLNAGTSVTILTTPGGTQNGDITVATPISKTAGGAATLTLTASTGTGGVININQTISSTVGALSMIFNAATINLGANLTSNGGSINFNNPVSLTATPLTINAGTGAVTFASTLNGASNLTVNATGTTTFSGLIGNSTPLLSIQTNTGGSLALNAGTVTTTGQQAFGENTITINGDTTLNTTNSSVILSGALDSSNSTARDLTINAGSGMISLLGSVGLTNPLDAITLNSTNTTTLFGNINTTSILTNSGGTTAFRGTTVTTTGASGQVYNDNFEVGNNLTLSAGSAPITIVGNISSFATNWPLTLNTTGTTTLSGSSSGAPLSAITTNAGGTTSFGGFSAISTTGNQTYNDDVTIAAGSASFTSSAGDLIFAGNLNGNGNDPTFSNAGLLSAITGVVSNLGSFSKAGTGTFALSNVANTYTGQTSIQNGVLSVAKLADGGVNSSLGATSAATFILLGTATQGTLSYTGTGDSTNRQFYVNSFGGGKIQATNGNLTLTGNILTNGNALTFDTNTANISSSGVINGPGTLTKTGTGTLTLSGANTYSGLTTVNGGTLVVTNDAGLGTTAAGTTVASGATLNLNNIHLGSEALTLSGTGATSGALLATGNVIVDSAITLAADTTINSGAGTLTLDGVIGQSGGARALTKIGSGTLVLSGSNTYSGSTFLNAGTLQANNATNPFGLGAFVFNGGNMLASIAGGTTLGNSSFSVANSTAATISGAQNITFSNAGSFGNSGSSLTITNTGITSLNGLSGAGSLAINSSGTLRMGGNNSSFSGPISLTSGNLVINNNGSNPLGTGNLTLNSGTLSAALAVTNPIVNNYTVAGDVILNGSQNFNLSGLGTINNGTNLTNINSASSTLSGNLSGTGSINQNAGTLVLAGDNNGFSGTINLNGGTLSVASNEGLGAASIGVNNGTTLNLNNVDFDNAISLNSGTLSIDGNTNLNASLAIADGSTNNIIQANPGANFALNDNINGAGSLVFQGTGLININGSIGNLSPLTSLTTSANSNITGNVFTTQNQVYNNPIALSGNAIYGSSAGGINFASTVNGANNFTVSAANTVTFEQAVGNGTALNSLNVTGSTIEIKGGSVSTVGDQQYHGVVALGQDTTLSISGNNATVALNNGISGNQSLNLVGGTSSNGSFILAGNIGTNNVNVTGGTGGSNTLNVDSNDTQTWQITADNSGNVSGVSGVSGQFNFANIGTLIGGAMNDRFVLNSGGVSSIAGGGGNNSLTAYSNLANTVNISSLDAGNIAQDNGGTALFSSIQNLTGGNMGNRFIFANNASVSGLLNGGSLSNNFYNTLNYQAYSSPITISLSSTNNGIAQTNAGTITNFQNINNLENNLNNTNTLKLPAKSNLLVFDGGGSGFVNDPIYFSGFTVFNSTSGTDSIQFNVPAIINASAGTVTINGVTMSFNNFGDVFGSTSTGATINVASIIQQPISNEDSKSEGPSEDKPNWVIAGSTVASNIADLTDQAAKLFDKDIRTVKINPYCTSNST